MRLKIITKSRNTYESYNCDLTKEALHDIMINHKLVSVNGTTGVVVVRVSEIESMSISED